MTPTNLAKANTATGTNIAVDASMECAVQTIVGFMLPFFLAGAGGSAEVAKAAIRAWIGAFNASNIPELDLAGRVISFSVAAMDNLRLSMTADLSDTKILRYRANAATLSRASDQARKILTALQAKQEPVRDTPRPAIAPALTPSPPIKITPAASTVPPRHRRDSANSITAPNFDEEAMKRDARVVMQEFSKRGLQGAAQIPSIADTPALSAAAAHAAMLDIRARFITPGVQQ